MSRPLEDEPFRASVLDRLVGQGANTRFAGRQTLDELLKSIATNLDNLLNTRWRVTQWPPTLMELEDSLVNFGIPDFTGTNMSNPQDRSAFCRLVEDAITRNDKRIKTAKIILQEHRENLDRTLRFKIEMEVNASPEPALITVDSEVDPKSHRIQISMNQ